MTKSRCPPNAGQGDPAGLGVRVDPEDRADQEGLADPAARVVRLRVDPVDRVHQAVRATRLLAEGLPRLLLADPAAAGQGGAVVLDLHPSL